MAVRIPEDIKYKEKIIAGCTVEQLVYMLVFFIAGIFLIFILPITDGKIKVAIVGGMVFLGYLFESQGAGKSLMKKWRFYKAPKRLSGFDPNAKKLLGVADIYNNAVRMQNGQVLGIIRVYSLDFNILPEDSQNAIILSFRDLVNSLTYPVQFVVQSMNLNVDDYLFSIKNKAYGTTNDLVISYYDTFANYIRGYIKDKAIVNRKFYMIVPGPRKATLEESTEALSNRCAAILSELERCQISAERLEEQPLINFYVSQFRDMFEIDEEYLSPYTIYRRSMDIDRLKKESMTEEERKIMEKTIAKYKDIAKDETAGKAANTFERFLSPTMISTNANEIQIGDKYHRVITAVGYPSKVDPGWLSRLVLSDIDLNISIHVSPYPAEIAIKVLENEIKKQKTDIWRMQNEGAIIGQALLNKLGGAKYLLEKVQSGDERMFDLSLYVDVKAYDIKKLNEKVEQVNHLMNAIMVVPETPSLEMYPGLQSCLPTLENKLKVTRNMTSSGVATAFPFLTTGLQEGSSGVVIGYNTSNNIPVILDVFGKEDNPNMLVLGSSGGGKSFFTKVFCMRQYMQGVDVNIIDPQREYCEFVEAFGGKTITISQISENIINPFDMMDMSLDEKIIFLVTFFQVLFGEKLTPPQGSLLKELLRTTYEKKGITNDPETWSKQPPLIGDLYEEVKPKLLEKESLIRTPAMALYNRLTDYVKGSMRFLNQHTKIKIEGDLINFDIRDIPESERGAMSFLILGHVYQKMKKSSKSKRKVLVVDEAWSVVSTTSEGDFIYRVVKTSRKFNLSLVLITQEAGDFLKRDPSTGEVRGKAVLNNTATKILLKQDRTLQNDIKKTFILTNDQWDYVLRARQGYCLLIRRDVLPIYVQASPEEYKMATSKPEERGDKKEESGGGVSEFSVNDPVIPMSSLAKNDAIRLANAGYHEARDPGFSRGRGETWLVFNPPGGNESDDHLIMTNLIDKEIGKYTKNKQMFKTKMPDNIFTAENDKRVAIEIETGKGKRDRKEFDIKINQMKNFDTTYFVMTDATKCKEYEKYGFRVLTRIEVPEVIKSHFPSATEQKDDENNKV